MIYKITERNDRRKGAKWQEVIEETTDRSSRIHRMRGKSSRPGAVYLSFS